VEGGGCRLTSVLAQRIPKGATEQQKRLELRHSVWVKFETGGPKTKKCYCTVTCDVILYTDKVYKQMYFRISFGRCYLSRLALAMTPLTHQAKFTIRGSSPEYTFM
jgi:hypothetical protein